MGTPVEKSVMHQAEDTARAGGRRLAGTTPRLYERAAGLLAERIRDGLLPAGSQVTETLIAKQLGISRPPARQALAELEQRGLVDRSRGRGYTVRRVEGLPPVPPGRAVESEDLPTLLSVSSWERIYGEVENEIIARISFADWRVNEAHLARHYHVSRTVARDVVGRLHQRGILRKDERSRWYAPALTPGHVSELYELRAILEPVALTKAAPNLPPGFIAGMRRHLEQVLAMPGEVPSTMLDRLEEEMHVELLRHCRHNTLMQAITFPQSLLIAHRFLYLWTPRMFAAEPFLPEHLEVVRHLEAGRTAAAAAALEAHLCVARSRAIARVDLIRREFKAETLPYLERLD